MLLSSLNLHARLVVAGQYDIAVGQVSRNDDADLIENRLASYVFVIGEKVPPPYLFKNNSIHAWKSPDVTDLQLIYALTIMPVVV